MKTSLEENKVILNETIQAIIQDYVDVVLKARVTEVYNIFGNTKVLRTLPIVDCGKFASYVNEALGANSQLGQGLTFLNSVLKSDDIELLRDSCLYRDILDGRVCSKPTNKQECISIIREIQQVITAEYNIIVSTLESDSAKTLGDEGLHIDKN